MPLSILHAPCNKARTLSYVAPRIRGWSRRAWRIIAPVTPGDGGSIQKPYHPRRVVNRIRRYVQRVYFKISGLEYCTWQTHDWRISCSMRDMVAIILPNYFPFVIYSQPCCYIFACWCSLILAWIMIFQPSNEHICKLSCFTFEGMIWIQYYFFHSFSSLQL